MKSPRVKKLAHGGARQGAGRPPKLDTDQYGTVNIVLRRETIAALHAGAGSRHIGQFLDWHLARHPLPSHEAYIALRDNKPLFEGVGKRRSQVLHGVSTPGRLEPPRRRRWAAKDLPKLTPSLLKKLKAKSAKPDENGD